MMHAAVREAALLLASRPWCHGCKNDKACVDLLYQLYLEDSSIDVKMVEGCLERMRIASIAGRYPAHMLNRVVVRAAAAASEVSYTRQSLRFNTAEGIARDGHPAGGVDLAGRSSISRESAAVLKRAYETGLMGRSIREECVDLRESCQATRRRMQRISESLAAFGPRLKALRQRLNPAFAKEGAEG